MKHRFTNISNSGFLISIITLFFLTSIVSGDTDYGEVSTFCVECHEDAASSFMGTPHSMVTAESPHQVFCVDCHRDWENHLDDPSAETINDFANQSPYDQFDVCSNCHFGNSEANFAHAGEHLQANVSCTGCHVIHKRTRRPGQLTGGNINNTCLECHALEMSSFSLIASHPVQSGAVNCSDCHNYFGAINNFSTSDSENQTCYGCHPDMEGPFIYEHEAARDYGLEDGGCLNCHNGHGSPFQYLLKEPTYSLCRQCHIIPGHRMAHDGIFAERNCLECHIDIHGSNRNAKFFNDWFLGSDCVECHD